MPFAYCTTILLTGTTTMRTAYAAVMHAAIGTPSRAMPLAYSLHAFWIGIFTMSLSAYFTLNALTMPFTALTMFLTGTAANAATITAFRMRPAILTLIAWITAAYFANNRILFLAGHSLQGRQQQSSQHHNNSEQCFHHSSI